MSPRMFMIDLRRLLLTAFATFLLAATCFCQEAPGFVGDTKTDDAGIRWIGADIGGRLTWVLDQQGVLISQTVDIETDFFSIASAVPKPAHLDLTTDSYKALYGTLVHPIEVSNQEFLPNVVVTAIDAGGGAGGLDEITYVVLTEPAQFNVPSHGLTGTLYIGSDGELSSTAPVGTFRKVEVGQALDVNTLLIHPGKSTTIEKPISKEFRATVWSRYEYLPSEPFTAIKSLVVNNGSAQLWRDDVVFDTTPTTAEQLEALTELDNADEIRYDGSNTGFTVTLDAVSYVSDVWLQLARKGLWHSGGAERDKCEILIYAEAVDVTPSKTVVVWDNGASNPVTESGINTEVSIEDVCEKIEVKWTATSGVHSVQGSLQRFEVFGRGRLETLRVTPGGPRIPHDRWEIVDEDKFVLCSNRWGPGQHAAQIGVEINTNETFMNYFFDWGRDWDTSSSTLATTVDTDVFGRRGYFDWTNNATVNDKYQNKLQWISLDTEFFSGLNEGWTYHPDDDAAAAAVKTARWYKAFESFRGITPNRLAGVYTHPNQGANVGLQSYFRLSGGAPSQSYYRRALERETIAEPIYAMCDYMCPPAYDVTTYSHADWYMLIEHYRDACHRRGKLCIPHISARNFGSDILVADFAAKIQIVSEVCDGWMIFESRTDNPHSEAEKVIVADIYRTEIDRLQSTGGSKYSHYDIPAGITTPSMLGRTSAKTNGSVDTITSMPGGVEGQLVTFTLSIGDFIDFQTGADAIDNNFGLTDPLEAVANDIILTFRKSSAGWITQSVAP